MKNNHCINIEYHSLYLLLQYTIKKIPRYSAKYPVRMKYCNINALHLLFKNNSLERSMGKKVNYHLWCSSTLPHSLTHPLTIKVLRHLPVSYTTYSSHMTAQSFRKSQLRIVTVFLRSTWSIFRAIASSRAVRILVMSTNHKCVECRHIPQFVYLQFSQVSKCSLTTWNSSSKTYLPVDWHANRVGESLGYWIYWSITIIVVINLRL